jgi:hypothetical protein
MRRISTVAIIVVLVLASFVAYKLLDRPQSGDTISFTYCGCGGCGGQAPVIKNVKNRAEFNKLKKELVRPSDSACANVGCSLCTEYRFVAS